MLTPTGLQTLKTRLTMYEHQHGKPMSTTVRGPFAVNDPPKRRRSPPGPRFRCRPSLSCCRPHCTTVAFSQSTPSTCSEASMRTVTPNALSVVHLFSLPGSVLRVFVCDGRARLHFQLRRHRLVRACLLLRFRLWPVPDHAHSRQPGQRSEIATVFRFAQCLKLHAVTGWSAQPD